jgi:hypothetical protein
MKTSTPTNFLFDDAAIAALARDYATGVGRADTIRGTYLRVLVAHAQQELTTTRVTLPATIAAIERADSHLYAIVKESVTTVDIADAEGLEPAEARRRALERNRRSNFARTAKSTLVNWTRTGGKLRSIDASTVTKDQLRVAHDGDAPTSLDARAARIEARVERIVKELAADSMERARDFITSLYTSLTDIVELPTVKPRHQLRATPPAQVAAH